MSQCNTSDYSSTASAGNGDEVRHAKVDALTEREFVRLLEGAKELDPPMDFEARVCILLAGKLGLRAGEISHFNTGWIDFRENVIEIPRFEACTQGSDGGICGYCRSRALDRLTSNNLTISEAKAEILDEFDTELGEETVHDMALSRREDRNITYVDAVSERWNPKTPESARQIPFDWDVRTLICIERFAERYDGWPKSHATVNRRINRAADQSGIEGRVYPHALRATAAGFHAMRDVSRHSLMSVMGWSYLSTADLYISASDESAAKEIRSKHR